MIEIERKFRLTPDKKAAVEAELQRRYGSITPVHQVDEIFLEGIDSFKTFKQGDPITRLRTEGDTTKFTYKRQINDSGDMLEHELTVDSADVMRAILIAMDYRPVTKVDKIRIEVQTKLATFALDTVKHLGDFLEIEVMAEDENNLLETDIYIMTAAAELGLTKADIEPKKYDKLMTEIQSSAK